MEGIFQKFHLVTVWIFEQLALIPFRRFVEKRSRRSNKANYLLILRSRLLHSNLLRRALSPCR